MASSHVLLGVRSCRLTLAVLPSCRVAKVVAPKRAALAEAESQLAAVSRISVSLLCLVCSPVQLSLHPC